MKYVTCLTCGGECYVIRNQKQAICLECQGKGVIRVKKSICSACGWSDKDTNLDTGISICWRCGEKGEL